MGTKATIAIKTETGEIKSIYVGHDGYPSHTGKTLIENYNNPEMAENLIRLGDLSFLDKNLEPDETKPHEFGYKKSQPNVTLAYHRDNNESWADTKPNIYNTIQGWRDSNNYTKYYYLFIDGQWTLNGSPITELTFEFDN